MWPCRNFTPSSNVETTNSWHVILTDLVWTCDGVVDVTGDIVRATG